MKKKSGFTLIELMIVIAIIAIIAAIAIPNLLRSRMVANEGSAIGSMRTITSAEQQFQSAAIEPMDSGMGRYGTLEEMGEQDPPFVDDVLASTTKQGYDFTIELDNTDGAPGFLCNADPVEMDRTGGRGFYVDESGVIRFAIGAVADEGSDPVQ